MEKFSEYGEISSEIDVMLVWNADVLKWCETIWNLTWVLKIVWLAVGSLKKNLCCASILFAISVLEYRINSEKKKN